MDNTQPKSHRKVMSILGISSKSDLDIVVGYLISMLKSESQEYKSQRERISKIITSQDTPDQPSLVMKNYANLVGYGISLTWLLMMSPRFTLS